MPAVGTCHRQGPLQASENMVDAFLQKGKKSANHHCPALAPTITQLITGTKVALKCNLNPKLNRSQLDQIAIAMHAIAPDCRWFAHPPFSSKFESTVGVKQGCPLSPTLLGILIDRLCLRMMSWVPHYGPVVFWCTCAHVPDDFGLLSRAAT